MPLLPGDPAPWFAAACTPNNPRFHLSSAAGRYVVLCFPGRPGQPQVAAALTALESVRALFDDVRASLFLIALSEQDVAPLRPRLPGIRCLLDGDRAVSRLYGAAWPLGDSPLTLYRPHWVLLDPLLRVIDSGPLREIDRLPALLAALPPPGRHVGCEVPAPVLILPRVFEPDLCRALIALYESGGGNDSGFMCEVDGKTVGVYDYTVKRRADCVIDDPSLLRAARQRLVRRVAPEIRKAFQFAASRIERDIVACYDGATCGHFKAHRDNTTAATAHRRFAVSVCLDGDGFDGGEVVFPEFGPRGYRAPTGGAVVFSCALLHAVTPVTRGKRYVYLPFLYGEADAQLRKSNLGCLSGTVQRVGEAALLHA